MKPISTSSHGRVLTLIFRVVDVVDVDVDDCCCCCCSSKFAAVVLVLVDDDDDDAL